VKQYRITCKKKNPAHNDRVEEIGCIDLATSAETRFTEDEAIRLVESRQATFVVRDADGHEATVYIEEHAGRKCLITKRDEFTTDNLLALPDCVSKPIVTPPGPPPRTVTPPRVHGTNAGSPVTTPFHFQFRSGDSLPLRDFYPQFAEVPVPPGVGAQRAYIGTLQPFEPGSDVLSTCHDLRKDQTLNLQAGALRSQEEVPRELLAHDPCDPWLIKMHTTFTLLALEFANGKHPQGYSLTPEISRQRFPWHPHLRDDLDLFYQGRYRQALCCYFAPDGVCRSMVDFFDFTSIYLAKHLMWERTLRLIDRNTGNILFQPAPGTVIFDSTEPRLGPDYSWRAAPFVQMQPIETRRFGWDGIWPGSAAPHDLISNLRLSMNSECHCGSGKPYRQCHFSRDSEQRNRLAD
jgi:hypothetical protein